MTPEEYERLKQAEKEHLKKLKELKQAVRALERQRKVQSTLQEMSRDSSDVLDTQQDLVERLAFETARHEARLDLALDSTDEHPTGVPDEELEEDLQRARAQALVESMKQSMDEDLAAADPDADTRARPTPATTDDASRASDRAARADTAREEGVNPTRDRDVRPEKTIGRM